jgi:thiol-disulfide isomerase/thioredoxin
MLRLRAPLLALLCAVGGLLACAAPAHADDDAHKTLREFGRSGQYTLYISKKVQRKARIFHSRRAGAFLILDTDYGKPWLILPREKKVATVAADAILDDKAQRIDLKADAELEDLGSFRLQGRDILIHVEGLIARLRPSTYALGPLNAEELLLHTPDYAPVAERYRPNKRDLQALIDCAIPTEVTIFFGTWCPTCKRLLPRVLKVDQAIEGSNVKITYYGLPKGRGMRSEPTARRNSVTRVPTGVIYVDGRRAGTISSRGLNRPETALCSALTRR